MQEKRNCDRQTHRPNISWINIILFHMEFVPSFIGSLLISSVLCLRVRLLLLLLLALVGKAKRRPLATSILFITFLFISSVRVVHSTSTTTATATVFLSAGGGGICVWAFLCAFENGRERADFNSLLHSFTYSSHSCNAVKSYIQKLLIRIFKMRPYGEARTCLLFHERWYCVDSFNSVCVCVWAYSVLCVNVVYLKLVTNANSLCNDVYNRIWSIEVFSLIQQRQK